MSRMTTRKRLNVSFPELVTTHKHFTKKELASCPSKRTCPPPIPVKARRKMNYSRSLLFGNHPRAVYFCHKTYLSTLYDSNCEESYMDQVFDSKTQIGEGSFGSVYKARFKEDGNFYAIKISKELCSAFGNKYSEVRRLEKVREHKNCIRFYCAWEDQGRLFIKLELCPTSLDNFATQNHNIPEEQLWDILTDMLLALKNIHDDNLIHLDIKPANIMIAEEGVYKLGDYGLLFDLSHLKDEALKRTTLSVSEGDSKYLAAEVLEGIYSKAADVFSLGITMLELATDLVLPSNGPLWHQLRSGIYPDSFNDNISCKLRAIIRKMIAPEYKSRPTVNVLLKQTHVRKILTTRENTPRTNHWLEWNNSIGNMTKSPTSIQQFNTPPPIIIVSSPTSSLSEFNASNVFNNAVSNISIERLHNLDLGKDNSFPNGKDNSFANGKDLEHWLETVDNVPAAASSPLRCITPKGELSPIRLFTKM